MERRWWTVCIMLLCVSVCFVGALYAQDDAADEAAEGTSWLKTIFVHSGVIGWLIIALSIVGVTGVIYNFVYLNKEKLIPEALVVELNNLFEEEQYEEALQLCQVDDSFVSKVTAAALNNLNYGYEYINKGIEDASAEHGMKLHQTVGWLNLIASIAPMMGLFGTVSGMIVAFGKIVSQGGNVTPADLAEGIRQALATTFLGLMVAIPILSFFYFFRNRIDNIIVEGTAIVEEMTARFRPSADA